MIPKNFIIPIFYIVILVFSCQPRKDQEAKDSSSVHKNSPEVSVGTRESLNLSIPDTLKVSRSFSFSNQHSKDTFQVIVLPGLVKNSQSILEIRTTSNKIIYSDTFETFHFVAGILQPDTIPTDKEEDFENYIIEYRKSLTPEKCKSYFDNNVEHFDHHISFIDRSNLKEYLKWGEVEDKEALKEVLSDPSIILANITCFDCDEGGIIIFYSNKRKKVITLLAHD